MAVIIFPYMLDSLTFPDTVSQYYLSDISSMLVYLRLLHNSYTPSSWLAQHPLHYNPDDMRTRPSALRHHYLVPPCRRTHRGKLIIFLLLLTRPRLESAVSHSPCRAKHHHFSYLGPNLPLHHIVYLSPTPHRQISQSICEESRRLTLHGQYTCAYQNKAV